MDRDTPTISGPSTILLLITSITFDLFGLIGLIPLGVTQVLGTTIQFLGGLIIAGLFWVLGVNPLSKKRILRFLGPLGLDALTFGILPGLTASVILTLLSLKITGKTGLSRRQFTARILRERRNSNRTNRARHERPSTNETSSSGGAGDTYEIAGNENVAKKDSSSGSSINEHSV